MNVFTEVYNKSVELLKAPALDESWKEADVQDVFITSLALSRTQPRLSNRPPSR